jgi:hypothetical protein
MLLLAAKKNTGPLFWYSFLTMAAAGFSAFFLLFRWRAIGKDFGADDSKVA